MNLFKKLFSLDRKTYTSTPKIELLEPRCVPTSGTWNGLGASSDWNDSGNWDSGNIPNGVNDVATFPIVYQPAFMPLVKNGETIILKQIVDTGYVYNRDYTEQFVQRGCINVQGGGRLTIQGNGITTNLDTLEVHLDTGGFLSVTNGADLQLTNTHLYGLWNSLTSVYGHGTVYVSGTNTLLEEKTSAKIYDSIVIGKTYDGTETDDGEIDFKPSNGLVFIFGHTATIANYGGTIKVIQPTSASSDSGLDATTGSYIYLASNGVFTIVPSVTPSSSKKIDILPIYSPSGSNPTINISGYVCSMIDTADTNKYAMYLQGGNLNFHLYSGTPATLTYYNTTSALVTVSGDAEVNFDAGGTNDDTTYTYNINPNFYFYSSNTLSLGAARSYVNVNCTNTFKMEHGILSFSTYDTGSSILASKITAHDLYFNNIFGADAQWSVYSNTWTEFSPWVDILLSTSSYSIGTGWSIVTTSGGWTPTHGWACLTGADVDLSEGFGM